jgi:hypothetical protein
LLDGHSDKLQQQTAGADDVEESQGAVSAAGKRQTRQWGSTAQAQAEEIAWSTPECTVGSRLPTACSYRRRAIIAPMQLERMKGDSDESRR